MPGSCCLRVAIVEDWAAGRLDSGTSDRTFPEASAVSRSSAPLLSFVSKVSVRTPAASKVRMWSRPSLSVPTMTRLVPEVGTPEPSPQDINRRAYPPTTRAAWCQFWSTTVAALTIALSGPMT